MHGNHSLVLCVFPVDPRYNAGFEGQLQYWLYKLLALFVNETITIRNRIGGRDHNPGIPDSAI
jgi:hypothetical protein